MARRMTKKQRAASLRNLKKARAALKRPGKRKVSALRRASALRMSARKRVGKRYGNLTVDRFIVPIGMSKKAARKGRKSAAGVPWSGKKGTIRYYGTRRTMDRLGLRSVLGHEVWTNPDGEMVAVPAASAKTNPFGRGPVRLYKGKKHRGTVFKAKRRRRIVTLAGARRVSRAWRVNPDAAPVAPTSTEIKANPRGRRGVPARRATSRRLTARAKPGERVVVFPNGRVAVFHKPGTAAFRKGQAKKRTLGKRLAKLYGFRKSRR